MSQIYSTEHLEQLFILILHLSHVLLLAFEGLAKVVESFEQSV